MNVEYSAVSDEIATMCAEMMGDNLADLDMDELSEDVMMQFTKKANEMCESRNIPRSDRAEVIGDGFEKYLKMSVEKQAQDFRYQLQMMFSL